MRAVVGLMDEKPLPQVTVADVVRAAGVNRSSFYVHYADLGTLFADVLEETMVRTDQPETMAGAAASEAVIPLTVKKYLSHLHEHGDAYRWAFGEHGSPQVVFRLRRRFQNMLVIGMQHHGAPADQAQIRAAFLSGAIIGALTEWLETDCALDEGVLTEWLWNMIRGLFINMTELSGTSPAR